MDKVSIRDRIANGWNAFVNGLKGNTAYSEGVQSYSYKPDSHRYSYGMDRSIISSILTRIALDCAQTDIRHVRLDDNGRYIEDMDSGLNECLTTEANLDQTGFDFRLDIVSSLLDEGVVALVPTDTDSNPYNGSFDILRIRVAKILEWFPDCVRVKIYNERTGNKEEIIMPKRQVAIIQNPLYAIMNEPNGTLSRLKRKFTLLDSADESASNGKLDLIVQLPYQTRADARKKQAEQRRADIERQLTDEKYGIAYIDATEKVIQLNRPVENQLLSQIEFLTNLLFSQLGITQEILNGSADEQTMLNYYQRTINPIIQAITSEIYRKFIGKTGRTQKQSIIAFRDPFKLVPLSKIAEIADTFTRNEILSSNEVRQLIGMKPSNDPKADELINSNLNHNEEAINPEMYQEEGYEEYPQEEEEM
jgi:hypothetical protein